MKNNFIAVKNSQIHLIEHLGLKGQTVKCKIVGKADFGIFVNMGNFKGLLHISEIQRAGKKISDFNMPVYKNYSYKCEDIDLYISSIDIKKQRISFSILPLKEKNNAKATKPSIDSYILNSIHTGTIKKITDYGLFITLDDGYYALLHKSEITKHNKNLTDFKQKEQIQVKILSVDIEKKRISVTF
ncbi:MAG: S1 RNA-binding domain-containing protein [Prevotellaceae bacterium]|jgi:small subunit ribosomal protein S1|nr:S1 RNA-binding domain-containing protein [Prevotellaceae bacterium]